MPQNNHVTPSRIEQPILTLSDNFHQYFRIVFADTRERREAAFNIRHQVYSEELGWEPRKENEMETDEFDRYSYACLLEHRATKTYAGCVRLVIPPPHTLNDLTPFEAHCMDSVMPDVLQLERYRRGSFGEISRLAVPASFRRRPNEKNTPFILNDRGNDAKTHVFSEEERRNFPNIAVGLYLASIALASICCHQATFVMMEPKLHRRLVRFGLPFVQAGEAIDYHGLRALFYLKANGFSSELNEELMQLYQDIRQQISQQISLLPYTDAADF